MVNDDDNDNDDDDDDNQDNDDVLLTDKRIIIAICDNFESCPCNIFSYEKKNDFLH